MAELTWNFVNYSFGRYATFFIAKIARVISKETPTSFRNYKAKHIDKLLASNY
jgi:hypothetical protein